MRKGRSDKASELDITPRNIRDLTCLRHLTWDGKTESYIGTHVQVPIPQEHWLWPDVGFGWAHEARAGTTLALCVLDRLLPPQENDVAVDWTHPLCVRPVCLAWAFSFYKDLLLPLPFWGGEVKSAKMLDWVSRQLSGFAGGGPVSLRPTPSEVWYEDAFGLAHGPR